VRRGLLTISVGVLLTCGLLGLASTFALTAAGAGTGTTSTGSEPTTTSPPTQPPPPEPPQPSLIAPGVIVGDLAVGWMTPRRASELVKKSFSRPLVLVVDSKRTIRVPPQELGARARIEKAIKRAQSARAGVQIPLEVDISRAKLRRYLDRLARQLDRKPVDAGVVLRGFKPRFVEPVLGRRLKVLRNALTLRVALATHDRAPVELDFEYVDPEVRTGKFGPSIVILRESKRLLFYRKDKLVRRFGIATGQASYPTPLGDYEITNLQRDPWWYPPPSGWAADSEPVPPGPGNPLGTRWMGISAPYVGIHGTPASASIGYSASHGCIRMRISDAEWLFTQVELGTPVFILPR
jgi:L,D-transpeptidase catalytic domain/Putative peptidoglycan binding domain